MMTGMTGGPPTSLVVNLFAVLLILIASAIVGFIHVEFNIHPAIIMITTGLSFGVVSWVLQRRKKNELC